MLNRPQTRKRTRSPRSMPPGEGMFFEERRSCGLLVMQSGFMDVDNGAGDLFRPATVFRGSDKFWRLAGCGSSDDGVVASRDSNKPAMRRPERHLLSLGFLGIALSVRLLVWSPVFTADRSFAPSLRRWQASVPLRRLAPCRWGLFFPALKPPKGPRVLPVR